MTMHEHTADSAAIRDLYNEWKVSWEAGDTLAVGHYFTPDSIQIPVNEPEIIGREAFEHTLREFFRQSIIKNYGHAIDELEVAEDLAYVKGRYTMTVAPRSGEMARRYQGRFVHILNRNLDGQWRIHRAIDVEDREIKD